jgi:hypothetical protein
MTKKKIENPIPKLPIYKRWEFFLFLGIIMILTAIALPWLIPGMK